MIGLGREGALVVVGEKDGIGTLEEELWEFMLM